MTYRITTSCGWGEDTEPPCEGCYRAEGTRQGEIIWLLNWDFDIATLVDLVDEKIIVHKRGNPDLPRELEIYDGWRE